MSSLFILFWYTLTLIGLMVVIALPWLLWNIPIPQYLFGVSWIPDPSPLGAILIAQAIGGALVILGPLANLLLGKRSTEIRSSWKVEAAQLNAEVSQDKVKALEAKIQTLETALAQALKK